MNINQFKKSKLVLVLWNKNTVKLLQDYYDLSKEVDSLYLFRPIGRSKKEYNELITTAENVYNKSLFNKFQNEDEGHLNCKELWINTTSTKTLEAFQDNFFCLEHKDSIWTPFVKNCEKSGYEGNLDYPESPIFDTFYGDKRAYMLKKIWGFSHILIIDYLQKYGAFLLDIEKNFNIIIDYLKATYEYGLNENNDFPETGISHMTMFALNVLLKDGQYLEQILEKISDRITRPYLFKENGYVKLLDFLQKV